VLSPASYDYPFRLDDDLGPGTGGMGCFTNCEKKLPFMTDADLNNCQLIMQRIIDEMRSNGLIFNGVLNGGFFITEKGIRFMEFNSRFGDPEVLNILTILQSSFSTLLENIWDKTLSEDKVKFLKEASVIKYLVAKEYPYESANVINFTVDTTAIENLGLNVFYATCVKTGENSYQTLKKSRVIAIGATSKSIEEASLKIDQAIDLYVTGDLEYRKDIGSKTHLEKLNRILHDMRK
jgi:phosphoribosylamine-glycine ligase